MAVPSSKSLYISITKRAVDSGSLRIERFEIDVEMFRISAVDLTRSDEDNAIIHLDSINCHELVVTLPMATAQHSVGQFRKLLTESTNLWIVNTMFLIIMR